MKEVTVWYTGTWCATLEVPADWEPSKENIQCLIDENEDAFDFQDGGADWFASSLELDGESIEVE